VDQVFCDSYLKTSNPIFNFINKKRRLKASFDKSLILCNYLLIGVGTTTFSLTDELFSVLLLVSNFVDLPVQLDEHEPLAFLEEQEPLAFFIEELHSAFTSLTDASLCMLHSADLFAVDFSEEQALPDALHSALHAFDISVEQALPDIFLALVLSAACDDVKDNAKTSIKAATKILNEFILKFPIIIKKT
jgi:hypothetical protein